MIDCGTGGWSPITSAAANSNFAGILAGFLFLGLTYLFGVHKEEQRGEVVALFSASFIILAFDSYLFARIAGFSIQDHPPADDERFHCNAIWMSGMAASGMLAVGAATLVVAVGYVLAGYDPLSKRSYLQTLAKVMVRAVLIGTFFLLFTSFNFYTRVFDRPNWCEIYCLTAAASALIIVLSVVCLYVSRGADERHIRENFVEWTVFAIAAFAILGTALAGAISRFPPETVTHPNVFLSWAVVIVSLGFPATILVLLAGATADELEEKKQRAASLGSPASQS
jgi:hypothetical protein